MEANTSAAPSPSPSSGSRPADANSADWRSDLKPETRKQVIQKLIDCFTKKFPIESHSDYNKVKVMAVDYEEKMYHHIRNKDEYIQMINTKLHELENLNPSHLNHSEADETSTHSGSAGVPSELPVTPSTKDNVGHAKQLPLQFTKKKFLHPSRPETHMQHQQREFLQPSQLKYPQQSLIQMNQTHPAMLQAAAHHHLQDHHRNVNQQSLSLQHPLQSLSRQQREHPTLHHKSNSLRQSNPIPQQLVLPSQQRQQFVYQKPNMQQIQMLGQPNKVPDMQQQQQTHQRSFGQTNNVIRQTQKIQATPLQHQQQLGPQNNIYLPKQQQILGCQSSVSSMEPYQKSMRVQQARCESQQQYQKQYHQPSMTSLTSQGQSQYPLSQQQLMPQIQSQQQVTMHQPQNSLQTEKQERIQASSVMVQSYISMEQQNQSIQSQTGQKEVSSQSLNDSTGLAGAVDWQEEIYQKIKSMKESYLPELYKKQQKIALKFQQIETIPYETLRCSIRDIKSVVRLRNTVAGSAPGNTSRSSIGEDLAATTKWHLQAKNFISQNGSTTTQKMKRSISAVCCDDTSEIEPTAKRQKAEANQDLLEEVLETNQQLCFTVIGIIDEEDDSGATLTSNSGGTMVKSSFKTASFSPNLRSKFFSGQMSPITPLRFLIPTDYPKCSPTILDRLQLDQSTKSEALSAKVWSVFDRLTRSLEQPVSLREMANTWDISVHKVIAEYDK